MRNIFVSIITALSTVFIALSACASETAVNTLASIAVFPVLYMSESAQKIISSNGLNAGKIVLSLEEALKDSHRFALFERSTETLKSSVFKEQDFIESSRAAANAAIHFGKMTNVDLVLVPIVTRLQLDAISTPVEELPGKVNLTTHSGLDLTIKIIDKSSGKIKYQGSEKTNSKTATRLVDSKVRPDFEALWDELAFTTANKIAHKAIDSVFPVQVAGVNGSSIFVNRGEGEGIAVGDRYDLFSVGEPLIDPNTKAVLGVEETLLAQVTVTRVAPRFSVVEPSTQLTSSPKIGDVLRARLSNDR